MNIPGPGMANYESESLPRDLSTSSKRGSHRVSWDDPILIMGAAGPTIIESAF